MLELKSKIDWKSDQDIKSFLIPSEMQANATHGLSLSPIRAHFQKIPKKPVLLRSNREGNIPRIYAHVQINSRVTVTMDLIKIVT